MKLTIINGSPRMKGRTGIASRYIARKYNAELIDLSLGEIPLYNGTEEQYGLPAVKKCASRLLTLMELFWHPLSTTVP